MNPPWSSREQDRTTYGTRPGWGVEEVLEKTSEQLRDSEAQLKNIEELKRAESLHAAEQPTLELIWRAPRRSQAAISLAPR
jgi:hypothetical protein